VQTAVYPQTAIGVRKKRALDSASGRERSGLVLRFEALRVRGRWVPGTRRVQGRGANPIRVPTHGWSGSFPMQQAILAELGNLVVVRHQVGFKAGVLTRRTPVLQL
jgi:hypothetical protein